MKNLTFKELTKIFDKRNSHNHSTKSFDKIRKYDLIFN